MCNYNLCNNERHNNCGCDNEPNNCEPVINQRYNCGKTCQVVKHHHVVSHQHDIINEYDIVHEHDYNYYDVVRERNVVRHNDYTNHEPNYCPEDENNGRNNDGRRRCR